MKYTILALLTLALATPAEAARAKACSKLSPDRCVTGITHNGKVRLPGGTWVDCAGDCKNKLRQKTVDFWYEQKLRN